MPSRYTFAEYSPDWPAEFEREAARWRSLLGDELVKVHHIGSSPGTDLLPEVRDIGRIDELTPSLVAEGYTAWGEYGLPGRRYFTKDRDTLRTHNVHVYQFEHPEIERHVAFCQYLRNHNQMRDEYAALKREVYARHPDNIDAYMDGKDAWIKRVQRQAVA